MEQTSIKLEPQKKLFFASDFHLGAPSDQLSKDREKKIINWIDSIESEMCELLLVGDIFDFWFEYKKVVPKGYVRFLGKIAALVDQGIPVHFFVGNHDLWMKDYFMQELGVHIHHNQLQIQCAGKKILVGHGDGFGPGDKSYKFLKKVFQNRLANWSFQWLHPNIGVGLAQKWSSNSRLQHDKDPDPDKGEQEPILIHCKSIEENDHHDYYVYGHRHLTSFIPINSRSTYVNLGEWVNEAPYAIFDGDEMRLEQFIS